MSSDFYAGWDAGTSFAPGTVIEWRGRSWQALRAIEGSFWPWSKGEVPGVSDAWRDLGAVRPQFSDPTILGHRGRRPGPRPGGAPRPSYPYPVFYDYALPYYANADALFDSVDATLAAPPAPEYEIVEEDGKMILKPRVTVLGKGGGFHHHHHGGGGGHWGPWPRMYDDAHIDEFEFDDGEYRMYVPKYTVDLLGAVDTGAWQRQMNTLKQVPVSVARILLRDGNDAIARAQTIASSKKLPGDTARSNVAWKLKWHEEALAKETNPHAMYASGDDLKKWCLAAYVEANAAEEGALWIGQAWSKMWNEIGAAIAALPAAIASKVNETAGALFGMPGWVVGLGALSIIAIGAGIYASTVGKGHNEALTRFLKKRSA